MLASFSWIRIMSDDAQKPIEKSGEAKNATDATEGQSINARSEAGTDLESGQLNEHTSAQKNKQFATGKSGVSGLFESDGNGGLPKAKDLFGDLAHAPLTKEKLEQIDQMKNASDQGQLIGAGGNFVGPAPTTQEGTMIAKAAKREEMSQFEQTRRTQLDAHAESIKQSTGRDGKWHFQTNPNDVAGKMKETLWNQFHSTPHESLNEVQAQKEHKLSPKDGDSISLRELLTDYKTPFIDAYEKSKHLQDDELGKSKTLESVVDRLKGCPWAEKINVNFDSNVENPEYDPVKSTITIRPQDSPAKQIEMFVHEATHATHQALAQMYLGTEPLIREQYAETLGQIETLTFKNEIGVHNELTAAMGAPPVSYR